MRLLVRLRPEEIEKRDASVSRPPSAAPATDKGKVCFEFQKKGTCSKGAECQFLHQPKAKAKAKAKGGAKTHS